MIQFCGKADLIFVATGSLIVIALISEAVAQVVASRRILIAIAALASFIWLEKHGRADIQRQSSQVSLHVPDLFCRISYVAC